MIGRRPKTSRAPATRPLSELLRLPAGPVHLGALDTRATTGFEGSKADATARTLALQPELSGTPSGWSTRRASGSGRSGPPTEEERAHPFLWRLERELPAPGMIGIFDRSQYEDVLRVRVNGYVEESVWSQRYDEINAWEEQLVASGTVLVKCFLHISSATQKERLQARLADPTKHWKYNPGDVDERTKWLAYAEAYEAALERCSTQHAPWYVVPSDRKWYRNWAVAQLLVEQLRALDLQWPAPGFDVEAEKLRLAAT